MTPIAPHIAAFLLERLPVERRASEHTCDSYAYAFQLLFGYASRELGVAPSELHVEQIDTPLVLAFLGDLETSRGNGPRTRNARLSAIRSFFRFLEHRLPSALEQIRRIRAIPMKRCDSRLILHLSRDEAQAILDAPDPQTRYGVRDRAMLHVALAGGLRVSELLGIRLDDVSLQPRPTIVVRGKGRKERALPLWKDTGVALRAWLALRGDAAAPEVFLNARRDPMTRAGFEYILRKHVTTAQTRCPSLAKKRVSPHVLRHTCAMMTLQATGDLRRVALWLGHANTQTAEVYTRIDPTEKLDALDSVTPPSLRRGNFRPPDKLLDLLRPSRPSDYAKKDRPNGAM